MKKLFSLALTERLVTCVSYLFIVYLLFPNEVTRTDRMEGSSRLMDLYDEFCHRSCSVFSFFNAHSVFCVEHTAASMLHCLGLSSLCRKLWAKGDTWDTLSFLCFTHMLAVCGLTSVNTHKLLDQLPEHLMFFLDATDDLPNVHQIYLNV